MATKPKAVKVEEEVVVVRLAAEVAGKVVGATAREVVRAAKATKTFTTKKVVSVVKAGASKGKAFAKDKAIPVTKKVAAAGWREVLRQAKAFGKGAVESYNRIKDAVEEEVVVVEEVDQAEIDRAEIDRLKAKLAELEARKNS